MNELKTIEKENGFAINVEGFFFAFGQIGNRTSALKDWSKLQNLSLEFENENIILTSYSNLKNFQCGSEFWSFEYFLIILKNSKFNYEVRVCFWSRLLSIGKFIFRFFFLLFEMGIRTKSRIWKPDLGEGEKEQYMQILTWLVGRYLIWISISRCKLNWKKKKKGMIFAQQKNERIL